MTDTYYEVNSIKDLEELTTLDLSGHMSKHTPAHRGQFPLYVRFYEDNYQGWVTLDSTTAGPYAHWKEQAVPVLHNIFDL